MKRLICFLLGHKFVRWQIVNGMFTPKGKENLISNRKKCKRCGVQNYISDYKNIPPSPPLPLQL